MQNCTFFVTAVVTLNPLRRDHPLATFRDFARDKSDELSHVARGGLRARAKRARYWFFRYPLVKKFRLQY